MIKIIKTWETVKFQTQIQSGNTTTLVSVELEYNHETGSIRITSPHEEGVSFKQDNVDQALGRAECVLAAVKYLKNQQHGKEKKKKRRS